MVLDKFKKITKQITKQVPKQITNNRKELKIVLFIILIIITILYFKAFFSKGAYFNDLFLKKEVIDNATYYVGKTKQGDIKITVKEMKDANGDHNKTEVIYNFPNNISRHFIVNFQYEYSWDNNVESITDESGNILFEGIYIKGNRILHGKKENEKIILEANKDYRYDVVIDNNTYKLPLIDVAEFATHEKDRIRGDAEIMIIAIILLSFVAFDIKYPLFFFTLSHFLEVKNPEPTDYYIFMQKTSWVVIPIISIVLLFVAI